MSTFFRHFLHTAAGIALATALFSSAPARADTDYTDHWSAGPTQNGWGVVLTQNDNVIYTEFFHYDANHKATWFGGTMYRVTDGHYSGPLYKVLSGDYYGHFPYDPSIASFAVAGVMDFNATDPSHGQMSYSIDGLTVLTQIERLTLVSIPLAGSYLGALFQSLNSSCTGTASSGYQSVKIVVTQTGTPGDVAIELRDAASPYDTLCTMAGAATQTGKVLDIPVAKYKCSGNTLEPLHVTDIRRTANGGIEGQWKTVAGYACVDSGRFSGIAQ